MNGFSVHLSLSPPNPPVKRQDCCSGTPETDSLFEHRVQVVTFLSKASVWFFTCLNTFDIFSSHELSFFPCTITRSSSLSRGQLHPILIIGTALTLFSAVLRLWCYRSLGQLFTFEITIRPKHELITSGPYAYVRHPSYTGVYLTLIGSTCVLLAPGTWTAEHGIRSPIGALLLCLWLLKCAFAFRGTAIRLRAEDDLLRANFGEEWENYAKRVPFRLVPGVY
ncbi:hypothetical protein NP233_g11443 [Leucocoprinus birnbaumii]|uniref:Protein-S-isoprenylcysteine O-methyltransferase n=1 Tax=Leucocoprinus birnbaumii TaxID=56174 RepID=A0AAD5YNZ3_9AGAR|nr:hypothetical protein NP233_g11443 [Leucocoprinus birnbaumii]